MGIKTRITDFEENHAIEWEIKELDNDDPLLIKWVVGLDSGKRTAYLRCEYCYGWYKYEARYRSYRWTKEFLAYHLKITKRFCPACTRYLGSSFQAHGPDTFLAMKSFIDKVAGLACQSHPNIPTEECLCVSCAAGRLYDKLFPDPQDFIPEGGKMREVTVEPGEGDADQSTDEEAGVQAEASV
jgi:hypothetical protein